MLGMPHSRTQTETALPNGKGRIQNPNDDFHNESNACCCIYCANKNKYGAFKFDKLPSAPIP